MAPHVGKAMTAFSSPHSTPGAILRVPGAGGTPRPVTRLDPKKEDQLHYSPQLLPGGQAVLFSSTRSGIDTYDDARIEVHSLATGERRGQEGNQHGTQPDDRREGDTRRLINIGRHLTKRGEYQ